MKILGKLMKLGSSDIYTVAQKTCTLTVTSTYIKSAGADGYTNKNQSVKKGWSIEVQMLYSTYCFASIMNNILGNDCLVPITFTYPMNNTTKTATGNAWITKVSVAAQGKGLALINLVLTGEGEIGFSNN